MEQLDLFMYLVPSWFPMEDYWTIYQNPDPYQERLNQMYIENERTIQLLALYESGYTFPCC